MLSGGCHQAERQPCSGCQKARGSPVARSLAERAVVVRLIDRRLVYVEPVVFAANSQLSRRADHFRLNVVCTPVYFGNLERRRADRLRLSIDAHLYPISRSQDRPQVQSYVQSAADVPQMLFRIR